MGGARQALVMTPGWAQKLQKILEDAVGGDNDYEAQELLKQVSELVYVDVPLMLTISEASALEKILSHADCPLDVLKSSRRSAANRGIAKLREALEKRERRSRK